MNWLRDFLRMVHDESDVWFLYLASVGAIIVILVELIGFLIAKGVPRVGWLRFFTYREWAVFFSVVIACYFVYSMSTVEGRGILEILLNHGRTHLLVFSAALLLKFPASSDEYHVVISTSPTEMKWGISGLSWWRAFCICCIAGLLCAFAHTVEKSLSGEPPLSKMVAWYVQDLACMAFYAVILKNLFQGPAGREFVESTECWGLWAFPLVAAGGAYFDR